MPVHALVESVPAVQDWSPAGSALRNSKPRWVREMAWSPLVAPPTVRAPSRGGAPTPATVHTPRSKRTGPRPSPWAHATPRTAQAKEKDGPCVGQYHVVHESVLPRAPAMRICESSGGSRLPPQSDRPASAPSRNRDDDPIPERMVESIRGKSPCADFGRATPRPDKIGNKESFWEVMEEKDITKLSTQKRSVGHQFGKAPKQPKRVQEGASWPPNVSYKHCSNESRTKGAVAFHKQSQRSDTQVPMAEGPKAGSRYPVKGFWDRVQGDMRHERCAVHEDDHAIRRRPKSVMDMSKATGRPLLTPEPKDSTGGRQSPSPAPDAPRSGRMSSLQDPSSSAVPHLPEDPVKQSQTWHQFTGRAPSPKGASRSSTPGGRKAASAQRENKGFAHEWALEECRRITEWFEWRHSKNQEQAQDFDSMGASSPRRFM